MRNHILIYINGRRQEVHGADVFRSLSDYLRYQRRLVGTKVVCAEGDCGSCTVFVGRLSGGRILYRTVTSCIQFMYQLDGAHIITIEGLKHHGRLNPVQEAMVRCQGTQCGFCTPGFVVSLHALLQENRQPSEQEVRTALVGNLCRCTGYQPILQAALWAAEQPLPPLESWYTPQEMIDDFATSANESVLAEDDGRTFFKPSTLAEAVQFRSENPHCTIFAGGTDLGVQINKGVRDVTSVLAINALPELQGVVQENKAIVAGAAATIAEFERVAERALPELGNLLHYFGSAQIRSAATVGGNIANASPIGDSMPAMYVLNAEIELAGIAGTRRVNMNDFYTGYKTTVMRSDELIGRVIIPLPRESEILRLYKVSRRKDLDISAFTAAIWMRMSGSTIAAIRIAYGGVGPNILRLNRTEAFLTGQPLSDKTMIDAGAIAEQEIAPISDVRGSAEYRRQLGRNILRKMCMQVAHASDGNGEVH